MVNILLLSDTHSYIDDRILHYASLVDQVWHAGDVGDEVVLEKLKSVCNRLVVVYGNIDGNEIRKSYPKHVKVNVEGLNVWMTHIGGYPGNYSVHVKNDIYKRPPDLFISGHSHILKVMSDKKLGLMHMNPGAAGVNGFHKKRTMLKFKIDQGKLSDLAVIELGSRSLKLTPE